MALACNPSARPDRGRRQQCLDRQLPDIQCYDSLKVQAILNEIGGKDHSGTRRRPVPNVFGMNFQAVSVGQKLIETQLGVTGGYLDNIGTPTPALLSEIEFVDTSIGKMVAGAEGARALPIDADRHHGQARPEPDRLGRATLGISTKPGTRYDLAGDDPARPAAAFRIAAEPQRDRADRGRRLADLAGGLQQTASAVAMLESQSPATNNIAGIGEIFSGPAIDQLFNAPGLPPNGDPRTPGHPRHARISASPIRAAARSWPSMAVSRMTTPT